MKKKKKGSLPYVDCLPSNDGPRVTPSIVHINEAEEFVVNVPEIMNGHLKYRPSMTLFDSKRLIGRKWNEEAI